MHFEDRLSGPLWVIGCLGQPLEALAAEKLFQDFVGRSCRHRSEDVRDVHVEDPGLRVDYLALRGSNLRHRPADMVLTSPVSMPAVSGPYKKTR